MEQTKARLALYADIQEKRKLKGDDAEPTFAERSLAEWIVAMISSQANMSLFEIPEGLPLAISHSSGLHFGTVNPTTERVTKSIKITNHSKDYENGTTFLLKRIIAVPSLKEYKYVVVGTIRETLKGEEGPELISDDLNDDIRIPPGTSVVVQISCIPSSTYGCIISWLIFVLTVESLNSDDAPTKTISDKAMFIPGKSILAARSLVTVISSLEVEKFAFDVFSKPFIPRNLIEVNFLQCEKFLGAPPPSTNFVQYLASWIPPSIPHFTSLLQVELATRVNEYSDRSMYSVRISGGPMWEIIVPGIVDDNPRIQIGDLVRLRRLHTFDGHEYDGFVYTLQASPTEDFNVQFVFNDLPMRFAVRAMLDLDLWIGSESGRKMLFPEPEDAAISSVTRQPLPSTSLDFFDSQLNWSQMKAVQAIIDQKHGDIPFLIWGPPGTGKTKTCIEAIRQIISLDSTARVLACAPSNSAADTLVRRLLKFLTPRELFRLNPATRPFAEVPEEIMAYTYTSSENFFDLPPMMALMKLRVLVTTCEDASMLVTGGITNQFCVGAFNEHHRKLNLSFPYFYRNPAPVTGLFWTHLFIDEAGQASEYESAIPLSVVGYQDPPISPTVATWPPIQPEPIKSVKVILSGDHMQLGPLIHSDFAKLKGLNISMFERIIRSPLYRDHPESRCAPRDLKVTLEPESQRAPSIVLSDCVAPFANLVRNYRSHPAMLMIPSHIAYNDTLVPFADTLLTSSLLHTPFLPNPEIPIAFFGIEGVDYRAGEEGASWWNPAEAAKLVELVAQLVQMPGVARLRQLFRARGLAAIDVGSVEDYQGMERRIILLSCVRSRAKSLKDDLLADLGLVHFPQRLNVAMTRAMSLLVIVGNPYLLSQDPHWVAYLAFYVRNGCYSGCAAPLVVLKAAQGESSDEKEDVKMKNGKLNEDPDAQSRAITISNFGPLENAHHKAKEMMNTQSTGWLGRNMLSSFGDISDMERDELSWTRDWLEDLNLYDEK
ncbi:hypothetical protein HDU76_007328 [Blyttiomyces sp. JEL0837]|nr:hypothetical protein HDU76_007328 [Blyttiomyces sp. JEL0837]